MWMMLVCCLVPVAILLFAGGQLSGGGYILPTLIGGMVIAHLAMMFKGHGGHGEYSDTDAGKKTDREGQPKKDEHTRGGCCH